MKRLILAAACFALIGAGTAMAQQDTTKTKTTPTQTPTQTPSDRMKDDMKGWSTVQTTEVPATLRQTLSGTQYQGWESGSVYKNPAGDTYSVQIMDKTSNTQKTYYFDKNGKVTKRPNERSNN
ncbi:MAG TPA: hypothetical protein VK508_15920 [Cyclobacteriaceae bacterium]|nr:hypothetical protein [Cyclobacteriaceae bacterium]